MDIANGQKLYEEIVQKAWDDTQFKNDLMENPEEAIKKLTGNKFNVPAGQTLVVRDQTDESTVYLNIPRKFDIDELELSDEQLEMVAGGTDAMFWVGVGVGIALIQCMR